MISVTKKLTERRYGPKDHDAIESFHKKGAGLYLKDMVYAANDGIVTTFAIIAGVVGASLSSTVVIVIGVASLLADGLSMAVGNYLGSRSERVWQERQREIELWEVENIPEVEEKELRTIYAAKGFEGETLNVIVAHVMGNKELWVNEMLIAEHNYVVGEGSPPFYHAVATFVAFVIAGALPIVPFLVLNVKSAPFFWAALFTGIGLFTVGASRTIVMGGRWWWAGLEMLVLGSAVSSVAFMVGTLLSNYV